MKITSAEFIISAYKPAQFPKDRLPEIAFAGRSNVGKSSLLNRLAGRDIAKISGTPGKTRSANFFLVDERYHFVDMPGYGYAKVPKAEAERWTKIYDQYIADTERNNALIQLIEREIQHRNGSIVHTMYPLLNSGVHRTDGLPIPSFQLDRSMDNNIQIGHQLY